MSTTRHVRRRGTVVALAGALVLSSGCANGNDGPSVGQPRVAPATVEQPLSGLKIDVKNDPGCSCCSSWVAYLEEHGATVEMAEHADRDVLRTRRGIPQDAASCHTATVDGYSIEGHVPVGAIQRLISERPAAAGVALPGMPADAPGMGGDEAAWEAQPVVLVGSDGQLSSFAY